MPLTTYEDLKHELTQLQQKEESVMEFHNKVGIGLAKCQQEVSYLVPETLMVPVPLWDPVILSGTNYPVHNQPPPIAIHEPLSHNDHFKKESRTIMEL